MAKKKGTNTGIPGVSFSAKRATGITNAKRKVAKATGIPTTKSGRQRKVGKAATGGGCLIPIISILIIITTLLIVGCSSAKKEEQPTTEKATEQTTIVVTTEEPTTEEPTTEIVTAPPIDWEQVNTSEYVRDGKKCIAYRVYVEDKEATDAQLLDVYKSVISKDSYYLHTVWIYFDRNEAEGGLASATIEETQKGTMPTKVERSGW